MTLVNVKHFCRTLHYRAGWARRGGYFSKGSLALVIKLHSARPVPRIKNLSLSGIYHNAFLSAGASACVNVCAGLKRRRGNTRGQPTHCEDMLTKHTHTHKLSHTLRGKRQIEKLK